MFAGTLEQAEEIAAKLGEGDYEWPCNEAPRSKLRDTRRRRIIAAWLLLVFLSSCLG
mgnify:CR=1 FL=1